MSSHVMSHMQPYWQWSALSRMLSFPAPNLRNISFTKPHKYRYQYEYVPQTGYLLPGSILSSKAAAADAFEHLNEHFPSTSPDFTTLHLQTNSLCMLKRRRDLGQGLRSQRNHTARRVLLFLREQQCQVGTSTLKHCWGC